MRSRFAMSRGAALALTAITLMACGSDGGLGVDGGAANLEPPPECALHPPPSDVVYPSGPYGQEVGDVFEDITLDDCDGVAVRFADVWSQAELVLFNVGAGWCDPCIEETETLDQNIFRSHCARGLRVVQVLFEDTRSRPATKLFCGDWKRRYGLSFPVLVDPLFITERYFSSVQTQTPVNFLVDKTGAIVFKETGTPARDLPQRIDQLLPP